MDGESADDLRALARHLVGPAEIGALLGVEANTINVWKVRHADFPQPVRRLKSGDIWDVREVRTWATATGRTWHDTPESPDSPPKNSSSA